MHKNSSILKTITAQEVALLLPARMNANNVNKSSFGHVVVIGGSIGLLGAPILAAHAAMRAGAGMVTVAFPEELENSIASRLSPVAMTFPLKQAFEGTITSSSANEAVEVTNRSTSVALGPGLGKGAEVNSFVRTFLLGCTIPVVVDADGLNALAATTDLGVSIITARKAATILTPHPKELARLLGISTESIQADREAAAKQAVEKYGGVVVLKGHQTIVTAPHSPTLQNANGNPGMATAGTGDVLTGVIAAMLAQKLDPLHAAIAGVFLHGAAGDLAALSMGGTTGLIATDLIEFLPKAIGDCQRTT